MESFIKRQPTEKTVTLIQLSLFLRKYNYAKHLEKLLEF